VINVTGKSLQRSKIKEGYKSKFIVGNDLLSNAWFGLPVSDGRVLKLLLKGLYKEKIEASRFYSLSAESFSKATGIEVKESRRVLSELGEKMRYMPAIKEVNGGVTSYISWFSKCIYDKEMEEFSIKFHEDILPYIKGLVGNFSQIPISICLEMNSSRNVGIAEWLYSNKWKKNKKNFSELLVPVEEFCDLFKVPESSQEYKVLKQNVLKPFQKHFMGLSVAGSLEVVDIGVDCRKKGRVENIKFIYSFV